MLAFGSSALLARSKRLLEILIRLGDCEDTNVIGTESVLLRICYESYSYPRTYSFLYPRDPVLSLGLVVLGIRDPV